MAVAVSYYIYHNSSEHHDQIFDNDIDHGSDCDNIAMQLSSGTMYEQVVIVLYE